MTHHKVQLSNLQPDTTYYFQVTFSQTKGRGANVKSGIGIFKTHSASQARNGKLEGEQRR